MRSPPLFPGPLRWLLLVLWMIVCGSMASAQSTTITGTVYSPLGPPNPQNPTAVHGDPIPNILVFTADPAFPPPTFLQGVVPPAAGQNGCAAQPSLVPAQVLGSATTDAAGNFSFTIAGPLPSSLNIVIQAGKWRRQYPGTPINVGGTTMLSTLTMPADRTLGDLPRIAVVTGSADAIECIFNQIGITTTGPNSEVTDPTGKGSINLYEGAAISAGQPAGGAVVSASSPVEDNLLANPSTLNSYDLVMFGCQGSADDPIATGGPGDPLGDPNNELENLVSYTSDGGRIFATHYGYVWLDNPKTFQSVADWTTPDIYDAKTGENLPATIVTTEPDGAAYPEGATLAAWMNNIGALSNANPPEIELGQVHVDTGAVNPPSQSWVNLNASSQPHTFTGTPSMQFTFDTPLNTQGIPTAAVAFTNNTPTFFQGDDSDSVNINVTNTGTTPADPTLTLSIAVPAGLTASTPSDAAAGESGWTCTGATPAFSCTRATPLAAGASDSVVMDFSIASTAQVGQATLTASLSGGGISDSSQCGRVLYNDYHVEPPPLSETAIPTGTIFPAECSTGAVLSAEQKFLEYSLYNLSNFVAPSTSDTILIQGPVTLTWNPASPITYGAPLTSAQLDATAADPESGAIVPGTSIYTYAGAPITATTILPAGDDILSVTFTPTDSVDYAGATTTVPLQVMLIPTTTQITGLDPFIYYGQIIGDTDGDNAYVSTSAPGGLGDGQLQVYVDNVLVCTLPNYVNSQDPAASTCPNAGFEGQNAGQHQVYAFYSGDADYASSTSPIYLVTINPDPTTASVASSLNPSVVGQNVTFTATIGDPYATAAGTVNFFDGAALLGSGTANAQGMASFSTSSLFAGNHNITACLVASQNFLTSNPCTPVVQTVMLPASMVPTVTLLTSSINPSALGQRVTFTATAATTGAFLGVPTGTVDFFDGVNPIGSGILTNGIATLATSTLTVGSHNITAAYIGSTTDAPSTSAVLAQQVDASLASAASGFLMTVTPTTFSVGAGSGTTVAVTILELNNFNQPVQLSCSGLPAEAACTFATSLIPAAGGTTPLTIAAAAPHNCGSNTPYFVAQGGSTGLPLLAAGLLAFFARRRRVLKGLLLVSVLCILTAIGGCGGNCTDLGVKPGTYTFTVTGTATGGGPTPVTVPSEPNSSITQSQTMTMTVTI